MKTLRKLIDQICCVFGFHEWGPWRYHVYSPGGYDQTLWKTRCCEHCAMVEEDFMTENERIYFVEMLRGDRECMPSV
jgi:hypothetical protein